MKNVVIAPVGENPDALFIGIKEFPTSRVVLLSSDDTLEAARALKKDLERFRVPVFVKRIAKHGSIWEDMFQAISEVSRLEKEEPVLINVSSGDRNAQCALTSAAYVNGIKAFAVEKGEAMLLPILKFSYYTSLTDKKLEILRVLYTQKDCCSSLEQLSRKTKLSLPLISYHINGNLKSDGLRQLGLVEAHSEKGRTRVTLSIMGKMLIKGYVPTS